MIQRNVLTLVRFSLKQGEPCPLVVVILDGKCQNEISQLLGALREINLREISFSLEKEWEILYLSFMEG